MTPEKQNTFNNPLDYIRFETAVKRKYRYVHDKDTNEFLDTVLATSKTREISLCKDMKFMRAQLGSAKSEGYKNGNIEVFKDDIPYPLARMKPLADRAKEGRANPKGIPCLYLSTRITTAIQEVRPWHGSLVTVATFGLVKDLTIVDCSENNHKLDGTGSDSLFPVPNDKIHGSWDNKKIEKSVWSWIDRSFSMPVDPSDDIADYVPTQILAELFKANDYDGIIFNSLFAEGKNLILFDINHAEPLDCTLYHVTNIPPFEFREVKRLIDTLGL
jgi:hypothetical protein